MRKVIIGGLVALAIGLGMAAPAQAMHYRGYLDALDAAGLIDHDGQNCPIEADGFCHFSQFEEDGAEAILEGDYVSEQLRKGRSPASVADDFTYSEGKRYNGPIIVAAATQHICNSPGQR